MFWCFQEGVAKKRSEREMERIRRREERERERAQEKLEREKRMRERERERERERYVGWFSLTYSTNVFVTCTSFFGVCHFWP